MDRSQKYRIIVASGRVAFVVDNIASPDPPGECGVGRR
jgi:hypothetical protein